MARRVLTPSTAGPPRAVCRLLPAARLLRRGVCRRRGAAPALAGGGRGAGRPGRARVGALPAAGAADDSRKRRHVQRVRRPAGHGTPVGAGPGAASHRRRGVGAPGSRPGAARAAARRPAGGRVRPATPARWRVSCRRSWCLPTPAFCGPVTAWRSPPVATCTSMRPTSGAPPTAAGRCWPTVPRAPRVPATRWRTVRCCRASCRR